MKIALPAAPSAAFPFAGDAKAQAGDPDEAEGPSSVWQRESRWRQAQHKRADQVQRQTLSLIHI